VLTASSGTLAGQPMFKAQETPSTTIFTRNSFAPRLGLSYDATGKGNTVLKASTAATTSTTPTRSATEPGRGELQDVQFLIRTATRSTTVRRARPALELVGRHDDDGDPT
jgi:hypothetical protein